MTIPLDATLTAALGVAFHTAAGNRLTDPGMAPGDKGSPSGAQSLLKSPYYGWGMAFNTAVGMGIAVTAYALQPDWMWMYWLDASRLPLWVTIYVFLMYPAMFTFGFLLADQAKKLRPGGGAALLTGLLAMLLCLIIATWGRIWNVGTISEWDAGACTPLIGSGFATLPLTWVLSIGFVIAVGSLVLLYKKFAKGLP
ncbi:MAG: hypothetical protein JEZ02_18200 [Desulfatibacillum sp.]|nr:hypothetical protein [Desulfatibacillum sp.]